MSRSDFAIRLLPPDVVAKLKSSTSITHLNGVVLELVKNALDANAHTVFVTVDVRRGSCIVEDDGDGIPPAEFESSGGLGKAHRTLTCEGNQCMVTDMWYRYIETGADGRIRPSRSFLGLTGCPVFAHHHIPPCWVREHKFPSTPSFDASSSVDTGTCASRASVQGSRHLCHGERSVWKHAGSRQESGVGASKT